MCRALSIAIADRSASRTSLSNEEPPPAFRPARTNAANWSAGLAGSCGGGNTGATSSAGGNTGGTSSAGGNTGEGAGGSGEGSAAALSVAGAVASLDGARHRGVKGEQRLGPANLVDGRDSLNGFVKVIVGGRREPEQQVVATTTTDDGTTDDSVYQP